MLAPYRLPGLFQDPRIIAAAVANATTALTKGLSAANQKFVFMLFSQRFEGRDFRESEISSHGRRERGGAIGILR
jgi:hypothetical protein